MLPAREVRLEAVKLPTDVLWVQLEGRAALGWVEEIHKEVGIVQRFGPGSAAARAMRKLIREAAADPCAMPSTGAAGPTPCCGTGGSSRAADERRRRGLVGSGGRPLPPQLLGRPGRVPQPQASPLLRKPPRTVGEFAERLGYSRSHLSNVLTKSWQETPASVLRRDRLERGRELLRRGRTVAEAAEETGYATHRIVQPRLPEVLRPAAVPGAGGRRLRPFASGDLDGHRSVVGAAESGGAGPSMRRSRGRRPACW